MSARCWTPPYCLGVRLILWDVDHTLIENNGVSKEIYASAFTTLTGTELRVAVHTEGRTDRRIMADLFAQHHLAMPEWETVYQALAASGTKYRGALQRRGHIMPGIDEVLMALTVDSGTVQSLLTGNIRPNAEVKLASLGLDSIFDFDAGGYGEDSDDRADLVALAQKRATTRYGDVFTEGNTLLIGDTPQDIRAGMRGGAHVLSVATGSYTRDDLGEAGATAVLGDFHDTARVMRAIELMFRPH